MHKLRRAMVRPGRDRLTGAVEVDETYVGGSKTGGKRGRGSERKEIVVIDYGVRFQGYHSDETKTLILGKPDGQQKKIYDLVRRAQEKAMKAIRPGGKVRRIDAAAREVISGAGYGKYFGHGPTAGVVF